MEKLTFNPIEGTFDVVDVSVEFYNSVVSFPAVGKQNIIYVDKATQKQYLWNGSYVQSNIPNLQEVTDVANVTSNNISVTKPFVGSTQLVGGGVVNTESSTNNSSLLSSLWLQVSNLLNSFRTRLLFPVTPTQDNNISLPNNSGTIALLSDIPSVLTPEQIQDSAFNILTDTSTIDLNYNDIANTVTATVIDNSITNVKLAKIPPLTVIGNEFATTEDAQYLILQPVIRGKLSLVGGQRTISDTRITTTSFAYGFFTSVGNITSVPLRANIQNGFVTFSTGQITDTGEFSYEIQF